MKSASVHRWRPRSAKEKAADEQPSMGMPLWQIAALGLAGAVAHEVLRWLVAARDHRRRAEPAFQRQAVPVSKFGSPGCAMA
jgi:hypothetical protein